MCALLLDWKFYMIGKHASKKVTIIRNLDYTHDPRLRFRLTYVNDKLTSVELKKKGPASHNEGIEWHLVTKAQHKKLKSYCFELDGDAALRQILPRLELKTEKDVLALCAKKLTIIGMNYGNFRFVNIDGDMEFVRFAVKFNSGCWNISGLDKYLRKQKDYVKKTSLVSRYSWSDKKTLYAEILLEGDELAKWLEIASKQTKGGGMSVVKEYFGEYSGWQHNQIKHDPLGVYKLYKKKVDEYDD